MKRLLLLSACGLMMSLAGSPAQSAEAEPGPKPVSTPDARIPDILRLWEGWATWGETLDPPTYQDPNKRISFWPSRLELNADSKGATFSIDAEMFSEGWFPLPGDKDVWPQDVRVNGVFVPVLERSGVPSIRLKAGQHSITGATSWTEMPQRIRLPDHYGIVQLVLSGQAIERPSWDASGFLWLQRGTSTEQADRDFLSVNLYGLLEDGIPMWLHTEIELIVSGKSREEDIGGVLPEGWHLASVESPLPVIIDSNGQMKAQVRAGRWVVKTTAFNLTDPRSLAFPKDPASEVELLGFKAKPDFRMVEITGVPSVDVSQTTYPARWREFPVYQWETNRELRIEQRVRGMGAQRPDGLGIRREWWLDESGRGLTFRDHISGTQQEIWRLDAAAGQDLGSVRSGGDGQLVTRNPDNGAPGVEIRTRTIDLEATGRMANASLLSASGWEADAENLQVTLNLPPGWRLVALFGADTVSGDWLTQWTLLDLFLLLIFTLAVFRLWGGLPAVLAFAAFALTAHEPGAPKFLWLLLLLPLGLLRVVPEGWPRTLVLAWKWATALLLVFLLIPFAAAQIQQAIYPQLEPHDAGPRPMFAASQTTSLPAPAEPRAEMVLAENAADSSKIRQFTGGWGKGYGRGSGIQEKQNLLLEAGARIQTGPGVPDWTWRRATFAWNGPVTSAQQVRPILLPLAAERILSVIRVALVIALAFALLKGSRLPKGVFGPMSRAALLAVTLLMGTSAVRAQIPDPQLLQTLRERLLETPDVFPNAAEIPLAEIRLDGLKVSMDVQIHTAARVAVPLPGRLPSWTPLRVLVNSSPATALRRDDGSLWVVLDEGVHQVALEGLLADVIDWEWSFQLKPRQVRVHAPDWTVSGIGTGGIPEPQVFFTRKQGANERTSTYERQDLEAVAAVERTIELGLVWRVQSTVRRLSPKGKALSLRVPLIEGENILSTDALVSEGAIEVRIGANQDSFSWQSEITPRESVSLLAMSKVPWAERWSLIVSPVWNVGYRGLAPIFQENNADLVPVWNPWPGEEVELEISRPEAIPGATVTVSKATHTVALGKRQRTSSLNLSLLSSLGEDFLVTLPEDSEITSLTLNGASLPVRRDGASLIVPLSPGEQSLSVAWKTNAPLRPFASVDAVTLPVASANIETVLTVPASRWVLWTDGPLRGPAVRFWTVLGCSLLGAFVLGKLALSPLTTAEWVLLALGLTQIPLPPALAVVGWFFFLAWRGRPGFQELPSASFNILQVCLVAVTALALSIFVSVVGAGLLGNPKMFITGNGSTPDVLRWYQASADGPLPEPSCLSISIWWYRLLMLLWALWLATALIRWLKWGWNQFSSGGLIRKSEPAQNPSPTNRTTPPKLPDNPPASG